MTHDELLHLIKDDEILEYFRAYPALRAVVKVHKPVLDTYTTPLDLDPPEVRERYECENCGVYYPCQTIKAIEEQLK